MSNMKHKLEVETMQDEVVLAQIHAVYTELANDETVIVSEDELYALALALTEIKMRDGLFCLYAKGSELVRGQVYNSIDSLKNVLIESDYNLEVIGYMVMIQAALAYIDAGIHMNNDATKEMEHEINIVDELIELAYSFGCDASLLSLLSRARKFDVPNNLFLDSINNVTLQQIVEG